MFKSGLPRIDGAGAYAKRVRIWLAARGLNEVETRAWSRILASAMRGVCWPAMAKQIRIREHCESDDMPAALAGMLELHPDGYRLTRDGMDTMVAIGKMGPNDEGREER